MYKKHIMKRIAIIMAVLVMAMGCTATASAGELSGTTDGSLGPTTYLFGVTKSMRAYNWAIKYSMSTQHIVETMKIVNMMCEYSNNNDVDYDDISATNVRSLSHEGPYGTVEITQAVAHFYIISDNFGDADEIVYYR